MENEKILKVIAVYASRIAAVACAAYSMFCSIFITMNKIVYEMKWMTIISLCVWNNRTKIERTNKNARMFG